MKSVSGWICAVVLVAMAGFVTAKGEAAMVENGRKVTFDYTLTVDGQIVDTTQGHEPFQYVHGTGSIIPGLSKQLEGLHAGDEKAIAVEPQDGYGMADPAAFKDVPRSSLPAN